MSRQIGSEAVLPAPPTFLYKFSKSISPQLIENIDQSLRIHDNGLMKLISNQISPNLTEEDSFLGLRQLWKSQNKNVDFSPFLNTKNYTLTNAARTALAQIINITDPPKNKKIGIPAFICGVVATPFLSQGYEICWLDTDANGLLSVEDFKTKSTQLSTVVVPHIWGQKADLEPIFKIAKANHIFVIEDGAHLVETNLKYCDVKILSFGREKVYSCVSGGAYLWNEDSPWASAFQKNVLPPAKWSWTLRHLIQPLILSMALSSWYRFSFGKALAAMARKTNLLPLAVTQKEKAGLEDFPQTHLPYPLQVILERQFKNQKALLDHRRKIAHLWSLKLEKRFPDAEVMVPPHCFRVILRTNRQQEILSHSEKFGFLLREWDGVPISPSGIHLKNFGYQPGSCPNAEQFARSYVTFPTNIRVKEEDVERF